MTEAANPRHQFDALTLEMLVCPLTKTRLTYDAKKAELVSRAARVAFPLRLGVPLLCLEEARSLTDKELEALSD